MIDTHAHLDALDADPTDALARARATGVWQVISVGTDIESCHKTLDLAEREEGVSAVLGLHPHEAGAVGAQELAVLEELLEHPKAVGVGETGLDYYRDYAPRDRQRELFESHCELAVRTGKALVIHSRAAEEDTAAVLRQLPRDARVVMHCFSSPALLDPALEHGWFISFAGNVTYPNASQLRTASTSVPADRLLAETDSPYLLPEQHPVRRARNEPAYVIYTLRTLAEARGLFDDELERIIEANASAAFDLP